MGRPVPGGWEVLPAGPGAGPRSPCAGSTGCSRAVGLSRSAGRLAAVVGGRGSRERAEGLQSCTKPSAQHLLLSWALWGWRPTSRCSGEGVSGSRGDAGTHSVGGRGGGAEQAAARPRLSLSVLQVQAFQHAAALGPAGSEGGLGPARRSDAPARAPSSPRVAEPLRHGRHTGTSSEVLRLGLRKPSHGSTAGREGRQ